MGDGNLEDKFVIFWNNRNARRKQSGSLIFWFKEFLDKVGHDKATLIMHTDVKDPHGQDLEAIIHGLGLTNGEVIFSVNKYPPDVIAKLYNIADCTINISDAEGFGLATFESLACETPINHRLKKLIGLRLVIGTFSRDTCQARQTARNTNWIIYYCRFS